MEGVIGEVRMFSGNFAPNAWMFCDGSLISIAEQQALYSVIGTTYGGDGVSTFALPDLRGRAAVGTGAGPGLTPRTAGELGGSETNTLQTPQLPQHTHTASVLLSLAAVSTAGTTNDPTGNLPALSTAKVYAATGSNAMAKVTIPVAASAAGNGQPLNNMQSFAVTNYIICLEGIYPDRP